VTAIKKLKTCSEELPPPGISCTVTYDWICKWTITKQWWNAKLYKNAFFKILICKNIKIWNIQIQRLFKDFQEPGICLTLQLHCDGWWSAFCRCYTKTVNWCSNEEIHTDQQCGIISLSTAGSTLCTQHWTLTLSQISPDNHNNLNITVIKLHLTQWKTFSS